MLESKFQVYLIKMNGIGMIEKKITTPSTAVNQNEFVFVSSKSNQKVSLLFIFIFYTANK